MKRLLSVNLESFEDCNEMPLDPNVTYVIKVVHDEALYFAEDKAEYCTLDSTDITVYKGGDLVNILPYIEFAYELVPFYSDI